MIYDHKDKETMKKFNVRAFPTFVITDAEGTELMRKVGAPFSTAEEAREWFPEVAKALNSVADLEAKHEKNAEDLDTAIELAGVYATLGKSEESAKLYKDLAAKVPAEHAKYVDVQLGYADALLGTINRENQNEIGKQISGIYDKVLPDIIKKGDDRAVDPAILNARIKMIVDKDNKAAREQMTSMLEPYAEHKRILEIKYWAAYFAEQNGEKDTAKAEYEAIIKAGETEDRWVKAAQTQLDKLNGSDK